MSALAYYLEREGLMTATIALVREHAEQLEPPRALWVSFPLGRPLGVPGDADFQHRVIAAALALLEQASGPVLEDYPEDTPSLPVESSPACPVSFPAPASEVTWASRLRREFTELEPWYQMSLRRRGGRTLVGLAAMPVDQIVERLGGYLDRDELPTDSLRAFKHAIEDAKAYYLEALTAQPGQYDSGAVQRTLWSDTVLGAALRKFYEHFRAHPDLNLFARIVLPREAVGGSTGEDVIDTEPDA